MKKISLKHIVLRFKWKVSGTFALVVLESLLGIFYPLLIGFAINDLLEYSYDGLINLGLLGLASLIVGSARRFYDTRVYSSIYCQIAPEMIEEEKEKKSSISKISARSSLLTEFVEFLENSMPEVVGGIISLFGILLILFTLNLNVFFAALGTLVVMVLVYVATGRKNYKLNASYNTQLEKQVTAIESNDPKIIKNHYSLLMKWNIKLSDLETLNYFIIWMAIIALFIYAPVSVIESGILKYGLVFAVLLYVFDFIDKAIIFPYHIQQLIRLKEISDRLNK